MSIKFSAGLLVLFVLWVVWMLFKSSRSDADDQQNNQNNLGTQTFEVRTGMFSREVHHFHPPIVLPFWHRNRGWVWGFGIVAVIVLLTLH